jgi:uncharacterized repeat protein (TIGR01451 family)
VLNITATVNATGVYLNTSEVTAAGESDPDSTPNNGVTTEDDYAEVATSPVASADLSLAKNVDNATPDVGSNVVFTLTVSNAGPSDATAVTVTDLLPTGTGYTYVSDDGAGAYNAGTGVWTVGGIAASGNAVLNITATVNAGGVYLNTCEVTAAGESDPDSTPNNGVTTEDDYAEVSTTPVPLADLSLTKVVDNATPDVGSNVVFTLTLSNAGPSDATGVAVSDLLPTGYLYVSDDAGGAYNSGTGLWTVGAVANSSNAVLNVTAQVRGTGDYLNVAEVTASGESDPDSTPNNGVTTEDDYAEAPTTPNAVIDLSLTKVVDNATPDVGTNVVFTITITNDADFSDATGVVVRDKLPTGYSYVSDDSASTGTSYNQGPGRWTVGNVAAGVSIALNITASVDAGGNYLNTAEVTAANQTDTDSTPDNGVTTEDDYAEIDTTPVPVVDLSLAKAVDNATPDVGSNVVFTLTVNNAGPSDATGVVVTDLLPSGYTYVSDDAGGAYNSGTGAWTVGPINFPGPAAVLNIMATVNGTGVYLNSAEVTAATEKDPDSTPNNGVTTEDDYAEITTTPVPVADLSLVKAVDNATPDVGSNVVFTLTATNDGPSDATGVTVTDLLPTGYTYVSDDAGGAYNAGTGIWTIGGLTASSSAMLNIAATVNASGDYTNTAEVTAAGESDPDSTPNNGVTTEDDYSEVSTTPSPISDLSLVKVVDNVTPDAGTNVVFTLTLTNDGPSAATGVTVTDLLPTGYTYVSDDAAGAYNSGTGVWTVGGVAASGNAVLNITARVNGSGSYLNAAEVTASGESDPDSVPNNGVTTEDDYAEVATTPTPIVDLSLVKAVDNATPDVGTNVMFTLTVSNAARFSDATGVAVTDLLPTGYTYVIDDGGGAYNSGTGVWTVGGVTAGSNAVLNITATVNATGVYLNAAEVTAAAPADTDSTPNNGVTTEDDYSEVSTTPNPVADLELVKVVDSATPDVGSNVVFTLTVSNDGPSDATGVSVTDLLPTGYTYVSDDAGGAYNSGTGVWTVGGITASGNAALNITATVNASGVYLNTSEVTAAGESDPDSTPNNGVTTEDDYSEVSTTPNAVSDLSLVKVVDNATPDVGSNVVFTLTVSNAGPSDATGVTVADLLPSGYTYVSDDAGGAYNSGTGVWTVGGITASGNTALNITATVNASGVYLNTSEVTAAGESDPDSTPNNGVTTEDDYSEVSTTPNPVADLSLVKVVDNATPDVGSNVVFTVTVSNAGPSGATGVVVTDLLPTGYTYVGDDGSGAYASGTGVWTVGSIASSGNAALNITATVLGSGVYDNVAEVTASNESDPDSTPSNGVPAEDDQDNALTTPNARIDLSLTKVVDNATPDVGSNVVFTLTVANAANFSDATGVSVTDLLPSGYTYVSDDGAGAYVSGTGVWTIGNLAAGSNTALNITATVNASGVYDNVAEVTAATETDTDSTPNNGVPAEDDQDNALTTPNPVADLSLTKTVDNATPDVGSNVVFTVTVSNAGPSGATGVSVTDLLPTGYTYVSDDSGGSYNSGTGVWTVGSIASSGNAALNITATVLGSGVYDNVAEVTASNESDPDSTPSNGVPAEDDQDNALTTPNARIDLSLTKVVDNATPDVGNNVVFTLTVANAANFSDATGVSVTDLLPSGYTYVSDDGAGAYVSGTGVWTIGNLAAGSNTALNITATVNATGVYDNIAEVTAATETDTDSTPNNGVPAEDDQDNALTTPNPVADLSLVKVVDNATPDVGSNVVFTVTVSNAGPSGATGVVVTDLLPTGYAYVSDDGSGAYVSGTGVWTVGSIASSGNAALNITATVLGSGVYDNVAEVTASNESDPDSTPSNGVPAEDDQDNALTTPNPVADLSLTKTVDNATPTIGTNVVFTLTVSNAGPSNATGVTVTDQLPSGYTYVSDDAGGSYNSGTGVWTVGGINASSNAVLNITATVQSSGTYLNTSEVTVAGEDDPDSTPNNGVTTEDDYAEVSTSPV